MDYQPVSPSYSQITLTHTLSIPHFTFIPETFNVRVNDTVNILTHSF